MTDLQNEGRKIGRSRANTIVASIIEQECQQTFAELLMPPPRPAQDEQPVGSIMSNLSPAAQAVLTAVTQQEYCLDPSEIPTEAARTGYTVAAALRAAVVQVTPVSTNARQMKIRNELLNIADELEDVKYGTYRSDLTDRPQ